MEILNVCMEVEPVPFNKGFYSVDITYFFAVKTQVYTAAPAASATVNGLACFSKKVILYGSEGNVRVFCSDAPCGQSITNMPKACVSCVDPIALSSRVCLCREHCGCLEVPEEITSRYKDDFICCNPEKCVFITLGMFTIVQLCREVQMMVPAYDFCIPEKECIATTDDPCEVFKAIKFPTTDFFPPREQDRSCNE